AQQSAGLVAGRDRAVPHAPLVGAGVHAVGAAGEEALGAAQRDRRAVRPSWPAAPGRPSRSECASPAGCRPPGGSPLAAARRRRSCTRSSQVEGPPGAPPPTGRLPGGPVPDAGGVPGTTDDTRADP